MFVSPVGVESLGIDIPAPSLITIVSPEDTMMRKPVNLCNCHRCNIPGALEQQRNSAKGPEPRRLFRK